MAIRQILTQKHPVLRDRAKRVENITPALLKLLDDMVETMHDANGVGLAAPQVGIGKRVIVVDIGEGGVLELINPVIVETSGNCTDIEGCLSIPGIWGEVPRFERIIAVARDRDGREQKIALTGMPARILQHENDHLDGVLFIDKAIRLVDPAELKREEGK